MNKLWRAGLYMTGGLWLSLLLCSPLTAGNSEALLTALTDRLTIQTVLNGHFRQSKQLPFLEQPFISEGNFQLSHSKGLHWQVHTPMSSLMVVIDGQVSIDHQTVRDHGIGQLISQLMLGFMDGNLSALLRFFEISGNLQSSPWHLELTPKGRLAQAMQHIQLTGEQYLQQIRITETAGASTIIELFDIRPETDMSKTVPDNGEHRDGTD
ncbi:MAG: outer membrane lipoprotein carrier protein LolA [Parahaliea sp.]